MIRLHAFSTPNSIKIPILLEELELLYTLHGVNIRQGEQKLAAFTVMNPNAKVPVLVDDEPTADGGELVLTESAAILVYLAEKHGRYLPVSGAARARVFEQLFFHASALGPAFGQSGFFQKLAAEKLDLPIQRFHGEALRTLGLLDRILADQPYVAGHAYSIADMAHFGWIWRRAFAGVDLDQSPHVARWFAEMGQRPAVVRAIARLDALISAS